MSTDMPIETTINSVDMELLRQRVYGIALGYEDLNDHQWLIAAQTAAGISLLTLENQQKVNQILLPQQQADHLLLSPDGSLLYASSGRLLRVWQITSDGAQLRETQTLNLPPQSLHMLAGGRTLLIQDARGVRMVDHDAIRGRHEQIAGLAELDVGERTQDVAVLQVDGT